MGGPLGTGIELMDGYYSVGVVAPPKPKRPPAELINKLEAPSKPQSFMQGLFGKIHVFRWQVIHVFFAARLQ